KSRDVLCHFLDRKTGYCNIYAFRNSVCSTFFCIHDHGDKGSRFWDGVQTLVAQVETALSQWALEEVGFDVSTLMKRMDRLAGKVRNLVDANGAWKRSVLKSLWGSWYGREVELLEACGEVVSAHRDSLWDIANSIDIQE